MRLSRLFRAIAAIVAFVAVCGAAHAQSPWPQPASDLAAQIASILGHGTARLIIRNLSSLPVDEIPAIRKLLEQDLRARGVIANSAPNDNIIRVTLSESAHGFTWVAEVIQGDDTQVAVVDLPADQKSQPPAPAQFMLRREALITQKEPVLGVLSTPQLVLLTADSFAVYTPSLPSGMIEIQHIPIAARAPTARDPRGMIQAGTQNLTADAWLPGIHCFVGPSLSQAPSEVIKTDCHSSDDPWPLTAAATLAPPPGPAPNPPPSPPSPPIQSAAPGVAISQSEASTATPTPTPAPQIHAFYNTARDYFTGVVSPNIGVDLPPYYSAAVLPRASNTALLIGGIDGKVLLVAGGKLTTVGGTSEWGSDFALIHSGCGDGAQIVVSGAGDSNTDSLRAYQVSGTEATPISTLLTIDGTVTALWSAPDSKSVLAVIRNPQNQYEVDRVTALCN
jgi:hypothetical protein